MGIKNYEELIVWQKSMDLLEQIYVITDDFPQKERYRLIDQLCRAAISIPSNIAEGSSRRSTKEFIRFINISYGSLAESETQLHIAKRLKYISGEQLNAVLERTKEIGRMLNALQNALTQKLTELRTLNSELL